MEVQMKAHFSLLILLSIVLSASNSIAQSVQWVKQLGAQGYSLKADASDHFYITGSFENNIMFGGIPLSSNGQTDIYITKYNLFGEILWVKTAGGEWYDEGFSLAMAPNGEYVYTTGFMNNALFEDTTIAGYPFFVAKHDSSGKMAWVKALITSGGGGASSISTDPAGNLYFVCSADGLTVPDSLTYSGSSYFIAKLGPEGTMRWIKGTNRYWNSIAVQPSGIVCDRNNSVYATGSLQTCIIELDSIHSLVPEGIMNAFIVQYDSNGNVLKALQSKGTGMAIPNSIAVDSACNMYITGCFEGSIKFGEISLQSAGKFDVFTAKYDSTGAVQWAVSAGGVSYETSRSIKVGIDGNVYIAGINSKGANFENSNLTKSGAFIAKYSGQGNLLYVKTLCSVNETSVYGDNFLIRDIEVLGNDDILVTGFFDIPLTFETGTLSSAGGRNIFIAKIVKTQTNVEQDKFLPLSFILHQNYPNPFNPSTTINYQVSVNSYVSLIIYDVLGREVAKLVNEDQSAGTYSVVFNAAQLPSGVYFYKLVAGTFSETKKLILLR